MTELTQEEEKKAQELYVRLLGKYEIVSMLDSPVDVFEQLCNQEIGITLENLETLRTKIVSKATKAALSTLS